MSEKNIDWGMIRRLEDQLLAQKKIAEIHRKRRSLEEIAFYPAHDKRRETKEYRAIHKKLVVEQDLPCKVCGVRKSTLSKDKKKNPFGANQIETHHSIIEWALANAVDVNKFNNTLRLILLSRHPESAEYKKNFTKKQIADWVDHSPHNLMVLCDVHHRARYFGIHEITYPIWGPQDILRDDFDEYVRKEIEKERGREEEIKWAQKKAAN